jgi:hypothetical protein
VFVGSCGGFFMRCDPYPRGVFDDLGLDANSTVLNKTSLNSFRKLREKCNRINWVKLKLN